MASKSIVVEFDKTWRSVFLQLLELAWSFESEFEGVAYGKRNISRCASEVDVEDLERDALHVHCILGGRINGDSWFILAVCSECFGVSEYGWVRSQYM